MRQSHLFQCKVIEKIRLGLHLAVKLICPQSLKCCASDWKTESLSLSFFKFRSFRGNCGKNHSRKITHLGICFTEVKLGFTANAQIRGRRRREEVLNSKFHRQLSRVSRRVSFS